MRRRTVAKLIQIDVCPFQSVHSACRDRQAQIAVRKIEVTQLRQQLLSQFAARTILTEEIEHTEFGKPYLKQQPELHFNYSHSQHYFALAVSRSVRDVGVDLEDLNRKVRFEALAVHAFHPDEYQQWKASGEDSEYWFKVWTTKEAVLKASGLGIRINLNELNTHVHPHQDGGRCEHPSIGVYAYQNYCIGDCMLTVAWSSEHSCQGMGFPVIQIRQHPVPLIV